MALTDIALQQLADPFRWGLIVALVAVTLSTQKVTGRMIPVFAGAVFVAFLIPNTTGAGGAGAGGDDLERFWDIAVGVLVDLGMAAVIAGLWTVIAPLVRR